MIVWVDQAGNALANNVVGGGGGGNSNPTATAENVSVTNKHCFRCQARVQTNGVVTCNSSTTVTDSR